MQALSRMMTTVTERVVAGSMAVLCERLRTCIFPLIVSGLKMNWDQKLSSGVLLTFMTIHLFQFRFADTEQYWLMTRLCFDKPLEILLAFLRQRNTCVLCW